MSITGYKKLKKLDNVKIGNLKKKNRDHKKVPKQDEDTGNLQILLHLRSLFWLYSIASICHLLCIFTLLTVFKYVAAVKIGILNVIEFASYQYLHLV